MKTPTLFLTLTAAMLLSACATKQPVPVVKTVRVDVPVPVRERAPAELLACGEQKPGFRFYSPDRESTDVLILEKDQPAFRAWVNEKVRCIAAWQEWGR